MTSIDFNLVSLPPLPLVRVVNCDIEREEEEKSDEQEKSRRGRVLVLDCVGACWRLAIKIIVPILVELELADFVTPSLSSLQWHLFALRWNAAQHTTTRPMRKLRAMYQTRQQLVTNRTPSYI
jgi:hypothetical protein